MIVALYAPLRDASWASTTDLIEFGPGLVPHLLEIPAVLAILLSAFGLMRLIAGAPSAEVP